MFVNKSVIDAELQSLIKKAIENTSQKEKCATQDICNDGADAASEDVKNQHPDQKNEKLINELKNEAAYANFRDDANNHPHLKLFDDNAVTLETFKSYPFDSDLRKTLEPLVKEMIRKGSARPYALQSADFMQKLDGLAAKFPNFGEVIEFIRQQFALNFVGDLRIELPPILLTGLPGIGKTYFANEFAKLVGKPMRTMVVS